MALLICITVKIPDIYVVNCTYSDGFDLNSTALCPICNGDYKEKTLSNTISGE
jgi:hypothetical protein